MSKYHDELGVSPDADEKEIKKAYRKKASKYHPDKEGGDPEKFKQLQIAYDVVTGKKSAEDVEEIDASAQLLMQLFDSLFDKPGDIIKLIKGHLNSESKRVEANIRQVNNDIKRIEKNLDRVKTTSDKNLYKMVLRNKLEQIKNNLSMMEEQDRIIARAKELLKTYTDEKAKETEPTPPNVRWGGGAFEF